MSRLLPVVCLALLAPLAACGANAEAGDRQLTVLAAASLTDAYDELAGPFEEEHDVDVVFSLGSSTDLAEQAADGAPGDVLATADEASMLLAEDAGVTGEVEAFATNVLTLVTPPGNPADVTSLDDLTDVTWVRCADEVPCGKVALAVLGDNEITAPPVSLEEDVRATLDKVVSGEADAGLVYATDAVAAGDAVVAVAIPGAQTNATTYFTSVLAQAADPDLAAEWVEWVTSPDGQAILAAAGFGSA